MRALLVAGLGVVLALTVVVIGVVSGRGGDAESGAEPTLVGPTWEWVETLGGDGSVVAPDDSAAYTLQLAEDGSAAIRADCNRAFGTYQADGESLRIEVAGVTRAACPAGSLGERYLEQLRFVRTYVIEDGTLYLDLYADAGSVRHRPG